MNVTPGLPVEPVEPVEPEVLVGVVPTSVAPGSEWARLHPLTPVLGSWRVLGIVAALTAQDGLRRGGFSLVQLLVVLAVVLSVASIGGYLSWRRRAWRVEGGDLRLDYGVIVRKSRRVPLARLQAIDVVRPLLARALGLAELRLEVVGHGSTEATLAYLTQAHAQQVRAYLLELAHRPSGAAPSSQPQAERLQAGMPATAGVTAAVTTPVIAAPTPVPPTAGQSRSWGPDDEAVLVAVPGARFVGSLLLSGSGIFALAFVGVVLVAFAFAPPAAGALAAALLPVGATLYRKFTVEFGFTVALSPQGLRLRHGLLDTRQQTVPRGRVQAIRVIEPLLWRKLGWLRLEVDVAGYRRAGRHEESSASGVLLPVGRKAEAERVMHAVLPGLELDTLRPRRPPARARWRALLSYHQLGSAYDAGWSVTSYGRIRKVTDVVPQDKLQSVRLVQGPLQRRLRLATVHLDTAGRNVRAAIRQWDAAEAAELTNSLAALARLARSQRR